MKVHKNVDCSVCHDREILEETVNGKEVIRNSQWRWFRAKGIVMGRLWLWLQWSRWHAYKRYKESKVNAAK